jgi:hypothetical protein
MNWPAKSAPLCVAYKRDTGTGIPGTLQITPDPALCPRHESTAASLSG